MATNNQVKIISGINGAPQVTSIGLGFPESDGTVKAFMKYCLQQAGWSIIAEDTYVVLAVNYSNNLVIRIQNDGNYPYTSIPIQNNSSYHAIAISLGALKQDGNAYTTTDRLYRNKDLYFNLYNVYDSVSSVTFYGNEYSFLLTALSANQLSISTGFFAGELNPFDPFRRLDDQTANEVFALAPDAYNSPGTGHLTNVSGVLFSGDLLQSSTFVMTDIRGIQGWHFGAKFHSGSSGYLNQGSLTYPNADGALDIDRVIFADNGQRRGYIPGMMGTIQSVPFAHGDTCSTSNQSLTRDFEFIKCDNGGFLIETSNHWNE